MLAIEHIALTARSPEESARFLADLLGGLAVSKDGPEDEFARVDLGDDSFVLFVEARDIASQHVAFQVDAATFDAIVARLRASGSAFGNDPESPENGRWEDDQGEYGRLYVTDPAGHFLEVIGKHTRASHGEK
jgi:catechol 2,3-dioxygenase-like lactoylglutathione lyase family enzyme